LAPVVASTRIAFHFEAEFTLDETETSMFRTFALIAAAALMTGCAAQPVLKPLAADDPANPQAPEAPVGLIVAPLTLESPPASATEAGSPTSPAGSTMQHMDMKGMK
jgi:hypothetical protein